MSTPSRRRAAGLIPALLLALSAALGCADPDRHAEAPQLASPSPATFIAPDPTRSVGPLRPASEAEISLMKKALPLGAIVKEIISIDVDSTVRVQGRARTVDLRVTEHEHRLRAVYVVGPTKEGLFRYIVTYAEDVVQKVDQGRVVTETSPVSGKSYLVEIGPTGLRVFTSEGYTPAPAEVMIVQRDYQSHERKRPAADETLRRAPRDLPAAAPPPSALVTALLRQSLESSGMVLQGLRAELRGVREQDGVPCAVFGVIMAGYKDEVKAGSSERVALELTGEYAVRLGDGWEAELALRGARRTSGMVTVQGTPVAFDSLGAMRMWILSRYDLSKVGEHRTLESLDRDPAPPPGRVNRLAACCLALAQNANSAPEAMAPSYTLAAGACKAAVRAGKGEAGLPEVRTALGSAPVPAVCR